MKHQRAKEPNGKIVSRQVRAEPEEGHLDVGKQRGGMPFLWPHARDAASLKTGQGLDFGVPFLEARGDGNDSRGVLIGNVEVEGLDGFL